MRSIGEKSNKIKNSLYNGYADYLKNVLGKDTNREIAPDDFDSIFTASMMLNDSYFQEHKITDTFERIKKASPDRFNREYECIYDIPIKKGTYMLAKNIKKDDIFIYNGCENVAIDDYLDNSSYLWVTSRERWKPEGVNCVYNYTSAMVIELKPNEEVEYVGKMK